MNNTLRLRRFQQLMYNSLMIVVGIDEVGRGAWAGPLVVGAVGLDKPVEGVKDSKLLSKTKRKELSEKIFDHAKFIGFGHVSNEEIDQFGLSAAMTIAVRRAISKLDFKAKVIIDGNYNYLRDFDHSEAIVGADNSVMEVSAASIIAKEFRDHYMKIQAELFPDYYFEKNVGYGTPEHIEALQKYGACGIHRKSYKPVIDIINGKA